MDENLDATREFGITFARLVAGMAMDPHGYFEKKYAARIEHARSVQEIEGVVAQLVQWVTSSAINADERARLEHELERHALPSLDDLRARYLP